MDFPISYVSLERVNCIRGGSILCGGDGGISCEKDNVVEMDEPMSPLVTLKQAAQR